MIWRENAAQQQQQHDLQQQQQPQQQQPKRLSFSFNVKIAVNVNTKMSTTHINPNSLKCCSQSSSRSSSSSRSRSRSRTPTRSTTTKHLVGWRQQLSHLGRQFANGYNNWQWPGQSQGHHHHHQQGSGISTILIVNLLLLLLLSLCCDVCCRSHAEQLQQQPHQPQQPHQLNYSSSPAAMPPLRIQENMRPTLDSDVVEKVAVWNKHVGAVAEGIAISSVARSRPFYAPDTPHYPHHEQQQQQQQQQQHDLGLEVETAIDERIAIEQVTRDCVQRCIVEEDLFLDEFGIKCAKADNSDKCYKTRCTNGCAQWYRALKEIEPCQEACVSTQFYPFDMPCIGACEMAQRQYWHLQRLAMTQLVETTQPQLVEMTGESATLTIRWDMQFPENYLASRPFNIQYQQQNEEQKLEQESPWHNMADYNCDEYYVCEIAEALMPYTRYKFRFELPFGESSEDVLYSPATPIYQTPMAGAPISAPIITTLLSLDEEHVAVHWRPGRYTNAPLQGYHIRLRSDASNASSSNREELLPASRGSFIFGELHPLTNYTVELTMINKQGKGPPAMASIQTKAPLSPEQLRSVLLTSERNISWQSLEPAGESRVIFSAEADATINDMVYSERQQQLWVLDSLGRLYRQQLEEDNSRQLLQLQLNSSEWRPRRLSLDWLQQRLYLAVEDPTQQHQLFSCNQDGGDVQQLVKTALGTKVQQLELDAVNGWLFWSDAQAIWRLDLHSKQRLQLHQAQQLGHFVLLPHRWLLQLLQQEDQLLELSYDGSHKRQLEQLPSAQLAANFALSSDKRQLLVANATQLQLLERHTLNVIASWPLSAEQELLVQMTPLERRRQPLALEATTPRELRALLGAQAAQISWQEPALNPYQAVSSNCSYELEVLDVASQSAYNIRNIRSPHFGLERLQPDNLYQLRVRAINAAGQAGEWTSALLSRTWPRGEHRLRWATQRGDLYVTNELGGQLELLPARLEPMSPGPLSLLNASIAYYVSNGTLRCINLLQPQLSCQAPPQTQHVGAVAYDWRGGLLYWTDLERDCVQRLDPQSGSRELLPIFGARHLALDPEQGHLYYASTAHLARRPMSAQDTQQPELEYYHVSGLAGQINGFSLDLQQRYIYWLVGGSSVQAELHLYRSSLSLASGSQAPEMIQLPPGASAVPHTLQFLQPLNALLWLQRKQASSAQLLRISEQLESEHLRPQELSEPLSAVQLLPSSALPAPDPGVRPLAVPPDSIRIDEGGHWDDFRLRWQPAASGGNHSICYKLLLEHGSERVLTLELATPFARITQLSHAPQQLRVSITPHTSWRAGPTSSVQLSTPVAAPTQPRRLRVFVERQAVPLQLEPNVSALLRWDVPEEEHGLGSQALQYRISCWQGSELHTELLLNQSTLEARIEQLQPDVTYRFQVQAHVAATGVAAGATSHALHVAPEVQSVPRLLYANAEHIGELDLDTATRRQLVHTASPVEHLALMQGEQRLLWVNEHVELLSHVPGSAPAKLARMRAEVLALTVDWVQRIVYWAELDASTQPPAACIYRLDLCRFEGRILQGERMWSTPPGQLLHDLVALPHARSLVWLQHELGARNATLEGRSLANGSALSFESVPGPLWRLFEGSQEPQSETLNLVDHQGRLCVYHVARQLCMPTALRSQLNLLSDDIAQLAQDAGYIYALRNGSVRGYSRRRQQLAYVLDLQPDEVRLLRAYNYQAYPSRRCLLLPTLGAIEAPMCEETHCQLQLPALTAASDCPLPVPGLEYQLQLSSAHAQLRQLHALAGEQLNITGLQPYRAYELRVRISSYYQQRLGLEALQLAPLELQTAAATPSAPRNFTGRALSPSELELSWAAPLEMRSDSVYYVLHWLLEDQPLEQALEQPLVQEQRVETAGTQRLTGLQPGRVYQVWVQAHATPGKFNRSESLFLRCYAPLPPLQLEELHAYGMTLSWFGTPDVLSTLALECQSLREQLHLNVLGNHTTMRLESLQPKTRYSCRLALNYAASPGAPVYYGASQDYETLGDAPSAPGRPQIEHIAGEIFRVSWTPAEEHGDPILLYNMEALQARRGSRRRRRRDTAAQLLPWAEEPTVLEDQWLDFCNTTELSCLVRDLYSRRLFLFRVRARNRPHGWGPYSEESDRIAEPFVSPEKRGSLVLAIIAPAAIVSSCVLALILVRKVQKRRHRAKKLLQQSRPSIWSNLSALQTQQQLLAARNRTFSMTLSDADIALLPQISWNRLTLLRFLGSGAFGEVYEGQLQGEDEAQPQRVAIKSLRKGASEFAELLQEAQLMSNFKHENIVCLIGICFDSESISLIMEHMEAGDLLSYLRAARPNSQEQLPGQTETQTTTPTPTPVPMLQLPDLLAMCLDVANGCSYLEDMHFVHRDLACRNCLVSNGAAVGGRRIVKIGDFGLARDIYKSDYYRKEGEGLLPVRWMALESLVDGIFSTQSDVWAFGVLCWEILTLGQQPYAARNNFEVLAHVKDGGRLQPPDECPEKLYALLLQCWRCEPWERPSFRRCYNTLQSINSELHSPSSNVSVPKPEARVHFDETTEHQSTKENTTPANSVSSSTKKTVADNRQQQLYANEGVSRL